MADFGYDISDYRDVDPLFGTLDDFDWLLQQAHRKGLRIMIDQVLSHTSVAFNLSPTDAQVSADMLSGALPLEGHGLLAGRLDGALLQLPPHGVFFATLP